MIELGLAIAVCALMTKVADADGLSPFVWFGVSLACCVAAFVLAPIPYLAWAPPWSRSSLR